MTDSSPNRRSGATPRRRAFLDLCRQIQETPARQAGTLGFFARVLIQTNLPYRRTTASHFIRTSGRLTIELNAPSHRGLPYGRYPRLILAWVSTEAVRTRSRHLDLGPSLSAFLRAMHVTPSGGRHGPIRRVRDQMWRLFGTSIDMTWSGEHWRMSEGFRIARRSYLCWRPTGELLRPGSLLDLSGDFFEELLRAPVPVDLRAFQALTSPLALDVYCWLTYRFFSLNRPTAISWPDLAFQFGTQTRRVRDFRRRFVEALTDVLAVYPQARVRVRREHLTLYPSPTHVAP